MIKKKEKNKLNLEENNSKIADLRKELLNLRFQKSSGQVQNTSQFKKLRRKIAQASTVLNESKRRKNA